jgi:autotransporter-associated beta strand protein
MRTKFFHVLAPSAALMLSVISPNVTAADGTWTADADGNWSDSGNWSGNIVADGADFTALFDDVITADRIVTLDSPRTIGNITFSDTSHHLTISGGNILTLDVSTGTPTINVADEELTISSVIAGNDGLLKDGSGQLTLSGTNTYTGGTVVNAGTLSISNVNHIGGASADLTFGGTATLARSGTLNFSSGALTVDTGATATISNSGAGVTSVSTTSGSGTLIYPTNNRSNRLELGNAGGFTGTLQARLTGNANYNTSTTIQFSSLGDGPGSALQFVGGTSDSGQAMTIELAGGSAPLVFNNRQVQTLPRLSSNWSPRYTILANNNSSDANTWAINTDLSWGYTNNNSLASRNFILAGSNTGNNAFNGLISETAAVPLNFQKRGSGKWILGGSNTFTGSVVVEQGTLSVSTINDPGVAGNLGAGSVLQLGNSNTIGTLEYIGSGQSTNRGILIGGSSGTGGASILNNGTGPLTFTNATFNAVQTGIDEDRTLTLGGSYTGISSIDGVIQDNDDANLIPGLVSLKKVGAGMWVLESDNTYEGSITVDEGVLILNGDNSEASGVTVNSGGILGGMGTVGGDATINSGATLTTRESAMPLAFNANMTLDNSSIYEFDAGDVTTVPGQLAMFSCTIKPGSGFQDGGTTMLFNYGFGGVFGLPTVDTSGLDFTPSGPVTVQDNFGGVIFIAGISVKPQDTTDPQISTLSPAHEAEDVAVDTNLVITFDEDVEAGSGNITLYEDGNPTPIETYDVTSDVSINGASVTIDPASDLTEGTTYYVEVASTAIDDLAGNSFDGFTGSGTWSFTTVSNANYSNFATANGLDADPTADGNGNGIQDGLEYAFAGAISGGDGFVDTIEELNMVLFGELVDINSNNDSSDDSLRYSVLLPNPAPADVIYRIYGSSVAPLDQGAGKTLLATYDASAPSPSWVTANGASHAVNGGTNADEVTDDATPTSSAIRFIWIELEITSVP